MANEKRLIDANALSEGLKSLTGMFTDEIGFAVGLKPVLWKVDAQPTVDAVEVVHGKWVERRFICMDNEHQLGYRCSECNLTFDVETNYCPNCGAKMDGDGNG